MATRLEEMQQSRLNNLKTLRQAGIDPYPSQTPKTHKISQAQAKDDLKVTVVGRLISWRGHGKLQFADLQDESGNIQLAFKADHLPEKQFKLLKHIDTGDFISVTGITFTTKTGERTVQVKSFTVLVKAINPLPNKWYGLKDTEERFRKRYLDLILNPEVKQRLEIRSKIVQSMRNFFDMQGFLEIETPTLQPVYGGGFARPFTTHHNALDSDFYLRISDEMYLKRLIVGGFEKVYEITKVFRNEGVDHDHNPEFTMMEAQIAYQDYIYGMDLIEAIFEHTAKEVLGTTKIEYQDQTLDVKAPWQRLRVVEAIQKYTGIDPLEWKDINQAKAAAKKMKQISSDKHSDLDKITTLGEVIAFVFEETCEEQLIQPTIIYDYPVEVSPLAKKCEDPRFTQRFEMFAFGSELGNNYTELNDPLDLKQRFVEEKKREKAGFDEAHQTDHDYLNAIEHGFPPTCGLAIGIDRMAMMYTNAPNIKEVIAFPLLKPLPEEQVGVSQSVVSQPVTAKYSIDPAVTKKFPGMYYAYTTIEGVSIKKKHQELELLKDKLINRHTLPIEDIAKLDGVKAYRQIFKDTGVWGMGRRPSPEALHRRLSQGKGIYQVNTAVDAYNLAVIETGIGLGGFDSNQLKPPITLRFTKKGESMKLLGDSKTTKTKVGELAYADSEKLITLDLNYRDIDATKITPKTTSITLFVDGAPGILQHKAIEALNLGAKYIAQFCGGRVGETVVVAGTGTAASEQPQTYDYKDRKIIAIINPELSPGLAANALGHMAFSAGRYADATWMGRPTLTDADGHPHTGISKYPFVVLGAAPAQIKDIVVKSRKLDGVNSVDYPQEMFDTGHDDDLAAAMAKARDKSIEYHAVLIWGEVNALKKLTQGLRLYGNNN
jgi:lysyl-tRNA synthetase class 2